MKTSLVTSAIVASVLVLSVVSQLGAQAGRPSSGPPSGTNVALIDIGHIFKNHIGFKRAMDSLGQDIRVEEDGLNKERQTIQKQMEKLKDYKPGTEDFKRLEEMVAQKQADFQVKAQIKKREFQEREASLYFKTIQEINYTVKVFAERNSISLVMKFNGDPIDPNDRESIMRELNKPVMYHNGLNITNIILEEVNRGQTPIVDKQTTPPTPGKNPTFPGGFGPRDTARQPGAPGSPLRQ